MSFDMHHWQRDVCVCHGHYCVCVRVKVEKATPTRDTTSIGCVDYMYRVAQNKLATAAELSLNRSH